MEYLIFKNKNLNKMYESATPQAQEIIFEIISNAENYDTLLYNYSNYMDMSYSEVVAKHANLIIDNTPYIETKEEHYIYKPETKLP